MTGINWISEAKTKPAETVTMLNDGTGAVEWTIVKSEVIGLTAPELKALREEHRSNDVNIERATDVKRWILEGLTLSQMEFQGKLRKGYCRRMLVKDRKALAPLLK